MRKVRVFKWDIDSRVAKRVPDGEGWFHCFAIEEDWDYDRLRHMNSAIIERADGNVEIVDVRLIQFIGNNFKE